MKLTDEQYLALLKIIRKDLDTNKIINGILQLTKSNYRGNYKNVK